MGRDVERPEVPAPDVGRARVAPDDSDRDRLDAILRRERDAAAIERDISVRDGEGRDRDRER
ncbi:hypothetical protein HBA92_20835 [Ochrobactrum sp. MR28]|nr:hypothetical protein [Ochrobactrum sp. MR28]MBX8818746.1 hypothetical protein [Ochrobactrum sp. MR31]